MKKENCIICNMCGKKIEIVNGIPKQDSLSVEKRWGYFSEKDGMVYEFDLCEECVGRLTEMFCVPVGVWEQKEYL